ncbi:hypothetical protein LXA43DRAFT_999796 [Ganoderma leucocontextum]|nr:hypothetical protein LXA43DRAFT_999796 [Ganoderma leucocontextum]
MYALAVLSVAVLAGQAVATPFASAGPLAALLKRQSTLDPSQIPAQCQSACASTVNTLNTCADVNCLCTDAINTGLYNCLECALGLSSDAGLLSEAQTSLTQFEQTCAEAGVNLAPLTLTVPNGSSATATGSSGTHTTAAGSNPTVTASNPAATVPAGTVNTAAASTNTAASSGSNPLGKNSAGMVGVSVASVAGAVGVAMAALL